MTREQRKRLLNDARAILRWNAGHGSLDDVEPLMVALAATVADIEASHAVPNPGGGNRYTTGATGATGATDATRATGAPEAEDAPCASL